MENEFVSYTQALILKELGFDEPCVYYVDKDNNSYIYNFETHPDEFIEWCGVNVIPTPTFSQAFRWFRDSHNLHGLINISKQGFWYFDINKIKPYQEVYQAVDMDSPEEAELECLKKLIEIVKNK